MKNIRYLIIILFMTGISTSCMEDWLEEQSEPITEEDISQAFEESDLAFIQAVNDGYNFAVSNDFYMIYYWGDKVAGLARQGTQPASTSPFSIRTWNSSNGDIENLWQAGYNYLNGINFAIGRINEYGLQNKSLEKRLLGEARFLRSLYHYYLLVYFGNIVVRDVPVGSADEAYASNKNRHDEAWKLIIDDAKFAEENLPANYDDLNKGRATQGAAKMLTTMIYLQRGGMARMVQNGILPDYWGVGSLDVQEEYKKAYDKAKEIYTSALNGTYHYRLLDDYGDVFNMLTNKHHDEVVYPFSFGVAGEANRCGSFQNELENNDYIGGRNRTAADSSFVAWWMNAPDASSDERIDDAVILSFISDASGELLSWPSANYRHPLIFKHQHESTPTSKRSVQATQDLHHFRYADVLLMYSEAANEIDASDKYTGINAVRERAGLNPLSDLSKEQFRNAIIDERAKELCFEGKAYIDAKRFGNLDKFVEREVNTKRYIYSIPQREIINNFNVNQNAGY